MIKLLTIFFLLVFDIITKKLVFNLIDLNTFYKITFFMDIAHIHNFGISFGLFAGLLPYWIIALIGLFISIIIILMIFSTNNNIEKWGLTIIFAGAISNILDRMMNGYVIDFIYLSYNNLYWPTFNLADIYITIGILIIIFEFILSFNKKRIKNNEID